MIVNGLKKSILNSALNGKLTIQYPGEVVEILPKKYNSDDKKIKDSSCNKNFPSNWVVGKFGKYITLISGQDLTNDRYHSEQKENSIPYLTGASNLLNGNLIINRYTEKPTSIANKENILLTCKGTIGETLILEIDKVHIARQFMAIVPNEMNTKYILYFLRNSIIELNRNAKSIIPGINREFVLNLDLPIPPIEEQQRIVDKIEQLFGKLDELKPIEIKLMNLDSSFSQSMKESILFYYLTGLKSNNSISLNRYNEIILPPNWRWEKFSNLTTCRMGKTILGRNLTDKGIPVYSATNTDTIFGYVKDIDLILNKGDLVIPARGNSIGCATIINDGIATCTQTTIACYPNNKINSKFLYYCCYAFKKIWFKYSGSAIPQITISNINNNFVPLPPIEEQQKIVDKIEKILPLCNDIEKIINEKNML